jgi:signal transduction histidine kinase
VLPNHFGIIGIHEQAALIGAEVRIESGGSRGTTIRVSMPLSPVAFPRER